MFEKFMLSFDQIMRFGSAARREQLYPFLRPVPYVSLYPLNSQVYAVELY